MGKEEDLTKALLKRVQEVDGRKNLACAEAFELAQEYQAQIITIGRICNQNDIKICKCQLGCFK